MLKFTKEPIQKGKMYYFVEYCNYPLKKKIYAICETHQKAYGIVRQDANEHWYNGKINEWNPLTVFKGYYI